MKDNVLPPFQYFPFPSLCTCFLFSPVPDWQWVAWGISDLFPSSRDGKQQPTSISSKCPHLNIHPVFRSLRVYLPWNQQQASLPLKIDLNCPKRKACRLGLLVSGRVYYEDVLGNLQKMASLLPCYDSLSKWNPEKKVWTLFSLLNR